MKIPRLLALVPLLALAAWHAPLRASDPQLVPVLENGDFEDGQMGWKLIGAPATSATINGAAARNGRFGLTITDNSTEGFARAESKQLPTAPGRRYKLTFWTRTQSEGTYGGISVRFLDAAGATVGEPKSTHAQAINTEGQWQPFDLTVTAPSGAASVKLLIHTYSKQEGVLDVDDVVFSEIDGALPPSASTEAPTATAPATSAAVPTDGARGLYIVIKVDDLIAAPGGVPPRWERFVSYLRERRIKSAVGIITQSLEADNPAFFSWIKDAHASGLVEFWHHGHTHRQWKDNGADVFEFKGPAYEDQRANFVLGQRLARERLGFAFATFGAPFNLTDAATVRVLSEDSDIVVWLYGDKVANAGKVVLDRDWGVNIENPIFVPSLEKFASGYAATSASRRYYVIQGHPAQWDDARFAEFTRIVDFLVAHEARFVTPAELARALGS